MLLGGLLRKQIGSFTADKRRLAGQTKTNGSGSKQRIAVFHRDTLQYLGSFVSRTDGFWELEGIVSLPPEKILYITINDTKSYHPIAYDYVSAVE